MANAITSFFTDDFSIDTTCIIDDYIINWSHARELTVDVTVGDSVTLRDISITGRGMSPPPFNATSFPSPIRIYFRKQGFEAITGTFYIRNVKITTEENEAWWDWTVEGTEVLNVSLVIDGITFNWNQARELDVSISIDDQDKESISISGRGIVHPPFEVDTFKSTPVYVLYTKGLSTISGTFELKNVSITGGGLDQWWEWELSGEKVSDNPIDRAYLTVDGVTLSYEQAKELDASISTESTTEPRTLNVSGRGTVPPPFNVDSFTEPVEIAYSKNGYTISGTFYISNISIEGEQEQEWWGFSIQGTEIVPTVCSINGVQPTWDQARELSAEIQIDILGLKQVSISGEGILPFSVGPFSTPVTIIYSKDGSGFSGTFFVTDTSLSGNAEGAWWSWTVEASELTSATCSINGTQPTWDQARELSANYSTDEDGVKKISITGKGTAPFSPTTSTEPVEIWYSKEGYGFSGLFTITSTSVDSSADLWWEWSVEGEEKSEDAGTRAYVTIDTEFSYDQAREINASIENLNAIYPVRSSSGGLILRSAWTGKHTISISGRGVTPPPILGNPLSQPVYVSYSKGGSGFSGTYFITESSVEGQDDGKWWSWSVSGEEI